MTKKLRSQTNLPFLLSASSYQSLVIALFHLLVVFVPLFFTFNTSELFEFNKMVATYAITGLIVWAWVTRIIISKKFLFKRTILDIPILLFVGSQLLAVFFSIHPYTSLLGYYSRFHGGFLSVITYVLLYYAFVNNVEKKHLPAFFLSAISSGMLVSLYAFLEHFGHSLSCLMVNGGKSFGVDCWIQDVKNRVFASFGQPNWLAAYLIMLLPVSFALALKKYQTSILNYLYVAASVLFFVVTVFTQSRSGFLGLAVGLGVFLGLAIVSLSLLKTVSLLRHTITWVVIMGIGMLGAALMFGTPFTPSIQSWLVPTKEAAPTQQTTTVAVVNRLDIGGTDSGEIRKIVWKGALEVWKRYPIFGSGLETFGYSYYQDRPVEHNLVSEWDFLYNKAHNEFLNFLATTGLVGLTSYVLLLGWVLFWATKKMFTDSSQKENDKLLVSAMLGSIVALSISNFFGFSTVMVTVLQYLYFAAMVQLLTLENTDEKPALPHLSSTSYFYFSTATLTVLFVLSWVYNYWSADVAYSKGKTLMDSGYFQEGSQELNRSIQKSPQEALFYDELASQYSKYAVAYAQQGSTTEAQALTTAAIQVSDTVMKLNNRQLNFYKTRARLFITLAQLKPTLLENARDTVQQARQFAPTDAKLLYNLGVVEVSLDQDDQGIADLKQAVEFKPNYESARYQLALAYQKVNQPDQALGQLTYIHDNLSPTNQEVIDTIASISAELSQPTTTKK
ncbi:MAG: hypothetical protein COY81_04385 [Candidatus Pacebacteria bacterium CG_4_10_14_0_8_um_filter_43_12]|nr:MAG: hypothetical protein COU66_04100 [Candidatus Pacebacteria bacterium CG10_big_fil_rev_8_21_14_0_10_44_11]PIY79123.1 MAG: hypothetical protein COY81_04385 [Candidatus Pacebacteria bacterium CG_4_10_14_0_8_um_filter_43_12]